MRPAAQMDTIQAVNRSLRCFVFGLLAFIPVLGLAMGVIAWIHGHAVQRRCGDQWNPAQPYLRWGRVLGLVGAFTSSVVFLLIPAAIANGAFWSNGCSGHT
jgi:hypothetical protein